MIILCTLLFFGMNGCNESGVDQEPDLNRKSEIGFTSNIIEVDSCQYVVAVKNSFNGGVSIIHKQNCKYCIIRTKK